MPRVDLVFNQQAEPIKGGPVRLVFGAGADMPLPTVTAEGGGKITGLRGHLMLGAVALAMGGGKITGIQGHMQMQWDANVSRGMRVGLESSWNEADPISQAVDTAWQEAQPVRRAAISGWNEAMPARQGVWVDWHEAERARAALGAAWQEAVGQQAGLDVLWQEAIRMRAALQHWWQEAEHKRAGLESNWQEAVRMRSGVVQHWQEATSVNVGLRSPFADGKPIHVPLRSHWQEAVRPGPGRIIVVPPVKPPCYVPTVPVHLVFTERTNRSLPLKLIFKCGGHGDWPPAVIVVPALRSYIVINAIEIRRADALAGDPLPSESFQMALNRSNWSWSFSAAFHASARDAVTPDVNGPPIELEVRVNGQPFRMLSTRVSRTRRFPEHLVTATGVGKSGILDAPYEPVLTFSQAQGRTAHQLMTEALMINGVDSGWSVDFGLQDWFVPGGAWMFQGTRVRVLTDIAAAVGGYLQPHDTEQILRVLPAWPTRSWLWDDVVPDIDLPEGIAEVDDTELEDRPNYNRIIVAGEAQGILADIKREGSPGDLLLEPMVVHPLITDIVAARQRAIAELSESGRMLKQKMTLPVLPYTGIIKPGQVLRYYDDAGVRRKGIVRGTSISQQFPVITQALEVDSHA